MNKSFSVQDPVFVERICGYFQQFMPISPDDIQSLLPYCEFREFEKRTVITKEGQLDNYLNLVVNGLVMKYVRIKESEVILQLATEGHVVAAEISFLGRVPAYVYLETLEPTLMISMRHDRMEAALAEHPRGEELGRKILESMFAMKDEKKFMWQSMDIRERFLYYIERHPHMLQRVPQKYLASYLNIKPETFSRLKHLTRQSKPEQG